VTRVQTYRVTAGRGGNGLWMFQCAEFPRAVSHGRSLGAAYELMPAEIAASAGVDPGNVEIDLVPSCTVVPVDEAQVTLPELVAEAAAHEIYLTCNHEAVAVLLASDPYERLLERVKELEDSLDRVRDSEPDEVRTFTPAVYER
jgi:hypothetical protein